MKKKQRWVILLSTLPSLLLPSCGKTNLIRTHGDDSSIYQTIKDDYWEFIKDDAKRLEKDKKIEFGYDDVLLYKSFGSFKDVYPVVILTGVPYCEGFYGSSLRSIGPTLCFQYYVLNRDYFRKQKYDNGYWSTGSFSCLYDKGSDIYFNFELPFVYSTKYYFWYDGDITYTPQRLLDEGILTIDDFKDIMHTKPFVVEEFNDEYQELIISHTNEVFFGDDWNLFGQKLERDIPIDENISTEEYQEITNQYYEYIVDEQGLDRDGVGFKITKDWMALRFGDKISDDTYILSFSANAFGCYYQTGWNTVDLAKTYFKLDNEDNNMRCEYCADQLYKIYHKGQFYYLQDALDEGIITKDIIKKYSDYRSELFFEPRGRYSEKCDFMFNYNWQLKYFQ